MKYVFFFLVGSFTAWAGMPPELGNFEGILMTGAVLHHPMVIRGGQLSNCAISYRNDREVHTCVVTNGQVSVSGSSPIDYSFEKATVIQGEEMLHYYYGGSRRLQVGPNKVVQPVSMTVNVSLKDKAKVFGFLEISNSSVRSAFEAFRK